MNQLNKINQNEYGEQITQRLLELLATGHIQHSDPKYQFFKEAVLPSLTVQYETTDGQKTCFYRCRFTGCQTLCSTTLLLERHLREQHYDELPKDVFGEKKFFFCRTCSKSFKRQEHLNMHKKAKKHLKILALRKAADSKAYTNSWRYKIRQSNQNHSKLPREENSKEPKNCKANQEQLPNLNLSLDAIEKTVDLFNAFAYSIISSQETIGDQEEKKDSLEQLLENDLSFVQKLKDLEK